MPTNNFKLFDQNKANLLSDTEYANATQRLNGVQTGVASSQLQNKFAYQVSLVAYAIAQIMNQNGLDATDTLAVSAFVGNLGGALLQKVADKASSTEAAAGVLTNKYISPATMKAAALLLSGGVMTGTLDMNNNQIINLPTPTSSSEPATKEYVDGNKVQKTFTFLADYETTESYYCVLRDLNDFSYIGISTNNKNSQRYTNGLTITVGNKRLVSYYSYYSTAVDISLVKGTDGNFVFTGSSVSNNGSGIVGMNTKISLSDLKTHGITIQLQMGTIDAGNYSCGSIIVI